ncbi:MAG: Flagellar FlbD family protein [Caldanaerobacter subterraneus]|jgi:flagellar protein FlbD|uniref:Flagellar FlbD family protein n=2 Tax=Thermoanaerobacter TaxID=1754 RepID=B0K9T8_THEP3|nr:MULTISPECIES: flagellar FlbD family protein [Thermoanaerobacter]KUJ91473.1 MAG: flagellar FlbD family protein [Thermoanaerobacter thermocopriae]KUK34176.1 MAG: Flagellar FlbD family protein [Caldanaerobacter subterraneus]ABY92969.1 flagellar FlbD family protein [Thermoanaerobacter sp. X514]ABY94901.1 flagellar FlbD family protein [Thermoanaerobacter pseudethanolicus ATCC 33223]ADV79850.1 flagellar FlbD family protein [Thermoanaerobacter brockii subsp. finnii Ako-1]
MIYVTRLNNEEFIINAELIEFIEKTPDTVISLTTGKKIVVKETPEEIIQRVIEYKQRIFTIEKDKEVLE